MAIYENYVFFYTACGEGDSQKIIVKKLSFSFFEIFKTVLQQTVPHIPYKSVRTMRVTL